MSITREQAEGLRIEVTTRLSVLAISLAQDLEYDQLVEFVHMIDDEVADSVFTDKLYNRVVQIRNEMQ